MNLETIDQHFYAKIILFQVVTTVFAGAGLAQLGGAPNYDHLLFGSVLGLANILLIVWGIRRAIVKKSFALVALASVFKYGFLIFLFWYAVHTEQRIGYEFIIGVILIFPTVIFMSYLMKNEKNGTL